MNKLLLFCFIFLQVFCGSAWAKSELGEQFDTQINISTYQPIDFCFLISRQGTLEELLFGTCKSFSAVQWDLMPGGTPTDDPDEIPVDLYFFQASKAYNVFFTENGQGAEWNLFVKAACTLKFTLLGGAVPGKDGSLKLFNGETELLNIVDEAQYNVQHSDSKYTIKYVPAPEKSTEEDEVTYIFHRGWNLLHFPIVVYEDARRADDNWEALNGLPRLTLSGRTYVKEGDIRCGEAFWVFYDGQFAENYPPNSLKVSGYVPLERDWSDLKSGWNFTGVKTNTEELSDNTYEWAGGYQVPVPAAADSRKGYWVYQ